MATKVMMEALSPTMEEGRLVEWKKAEGDPVSQGDVLAEVETDKAVMELAARADGVLLRQLVAAGETVPVASVIGWIGKEGEDVPEDGKGEGRKGGKPEGQKAEKPAKPAEEEAGEEAEEEEAPEETRAEEGEEEEAEEKTGEEEAEDEREAKPAPLGARVRKAEAARKPKAPSVLKGAARPEAPAWAMTTARPAGRGAAERVKASPLARKLAQERGVDLSVIEGSGPEGRVVKRDVEAAAAAPAAAAAAGPGREGPPWEDVPLSQVRKTIARRLVQSLGPIPTYYLTTEVDMERAADAREALRAEFGDPGRISFNDIILKAVATALRQHRECNGWWQDDHIRYWNEVHLGMAVAIPDGLITPVIRHADLKSLRQIAEEARELAERARKRKLAPEEYTGATFTVSNLGMFDIDEFTAIINPPEAGVVAAGRMAPTPVVVDGQITVRRGMRLTMSCDHRVIDGATGAEFLRTLRRMLENPLALVW